MKLRWTIRPIATDRLFGVCEGVQLCFQRLIVLPLDLEFGLKLLHLKVKTGNLGAEFCEVGADGARLWRCRRRAL